MPRIRWVPIGKSNCYLNEEKSQPSPIYKIAVDILKQTNFFRAFTASSTIPAIYIQQFWDTICFDSKAGSYKCQLDEQWFDLTKDTLRDSSSYHSSPDNNRAFSPPPTPDTLVEFVNKLGYPKEVIHLSNVTTNDMFQPWRALTTIINLCLTGKTSGFERPRAPVLQIHWGVVSLEPPQRLSLKMGGGEGVGRIYSIHPHFHRRQKEFGTTYSREEESNSYPYPEYQVHKVDHISPATAAQLPPKTRVSTPLAYRGTCTRETDTGKLQPLPEVPGKGKEKVGEEQAAQVLLNLQTPKKKSPDERIHIQRRSRETDSDEARSRLSEAGLNMKPGWRSDPGKLDEGQAGPNPKKFAESQPLPTPSVLAGPNLEHSDVEITDASSQPQPEHMDEGFTATAYPNVQENLKLTTNEQVIPEEPASSTGTLSSLQQLGKDFSFGDQFFNDKPSDAENEKTTADTEVESMVSISIQQDTSVIPPMTSPVIGPVPRPDSPNVHWPLPTTTTTTSATTTTTLPLPPQPQQGPSDPIIIKRMGELEELIANLVEENQALEEQQEIDRKINESVKEVVISSVKHAMRAPLRARFKDLPTSDMKEILLQRMLEENYDKGHADHRVAYEALQVSIRRDECEDFDVDKAQEETKKKSKQDSPKTPPGSPPSPPPPPPPPSGASGASGTTGASDSAQAPPPPPPSSSTHQGDQSTSTAAPSSSKTLVNS
ncbi:hypothetical protein Tco_0011648 [Tanacetum coccineum]